MAKETKSTTPKAADKAPAAKAAAPKAFDPKANELETRAERASRLAGETIKTVPHTVLPGKSVRQGGQRFLEGDTVHLSPADAERMVATRVVALGDAGAKSVAKAQAEADQAAADAEAAETAQREADEASAKAAAAAAEAAGQVSGAENR